MHKIKAPRAWSFFSNTALSVQESDSYTEDHANPSLGMFPDSTIYNTGLDP